MPGGIDSVTPSYGYDGARPLASTLPGNTEPYRPPLTSISGFAEMLQQGFGGDLPPQGREYVAAILDSAARLGGLPVPARELADLTAIRLFGAQPAACHRHCGARLVAAMSSTHGRFQRLAR